MKELTDNQLIPLLASDCAPQTYYVAANDVFLLERCEHRIRDGRGCTVTQRFDVSSPDEEGLKQAFLNVPLLADPTLVVLDGFLPSALSEGFSALCAELFSDVPPHITLVAEALYPDARFSASKKTAALLGDGTAIVTAARRQGSELRDELRALAESEGVQIAPDAAALLVERSGDDLCEQQNQIKKAAALCGYTKIERRHVEAVAPKTIDTWVYELVRSLSSGDEARAADRLTALLRERQEPVMICSVLINSYVGMYRASAAREKGLSLGEFSEAFGYKKNDVKAKIAYEQCASYGAGRLEKIVDILYNADSALKSSRADADVILTCALAEIIAAKKSG